MAGSGEGTRSNIGLAFLAFGVALAAAVFSVTQSYLGVLRVEMMGHGIDNSTVPAGRGLSQIWVELENVRGGLSVVYMLLCAAVVFSAALAVYVELVRTRTLRRRMTWWLMLSSLSFYVAALIAGMQLSSGNHPNLVVDYGIGLLIAGLANAAARSAWIQGRIA